MCRLIYELMQSSPGRVDASRDVTSVDTIYHFHGHSNFTSIALAEYTVRDNGEIDLKPGDRIQLTSVAVLNYNVRFDGGGYVEGTNLRTGLRGRFPAHKVRDELKTFAASTV